MKENPSFGSTKNYTIASPFTNEDLHFK